jgi:hypothetical protein
MTGAKRGAKANEVVLCHSPGLVSSRSLQETRRENSDLDCGECTTRCYLSLFADGERLGATVGVIFCICWDRRSGWYKLYAIAPFRVPNGLALLRRIQSDNASMQYNVTQVRNSIKPLGLHREMSNPLLFRFVTRFIIGALKRE